MKNLILMLALLGHTAAAQTVIDSLNDIRSGDPTYLDVTRVRVRQLTDKIQVDIYPATGIPPGNQAGINASTVYEFYMDVDGDSATGTLLGDLGYDYRLRLDLFDWNGKSWIDGTVHWGFDRWGNWSHQDGFFVSSSGLIPQRFRWEFSLISLKWSRIAWALRVYYRDHWTERVPDAGHAILDIDTSVVPNLTTAALGCVEMTYPATFQAVMDSFDVLRTLNAAALVESTLCQTSFSSQPLRIQFNPWLNGVNYCGNPVMLGAWSWGATPPWFIILHELGHNFTLASSRFRKLYPGGGYTAAGGDDWHFGTNYVEAWASMVGFVAADQVCRAPQSFGISATAAQSLRGDMAGLKESFLAKLRTYAQSPDHSRLYPDLVDGILLSLADSFGVDLIPRWYRILHPPDAPWPALDLIRPTTDYTDAKIRAMTITAAGFSVAAGADLRTLFETRWDFPLDDDVYEDVLPEIRAMIDGATGVIDRGTVSRDIAVLGNFPNPFNASTRVALHLPRRASVGLSVFDMEGRKVSERCLGTLDPGRHDVILDGKGLASGAYIYVVETSWARVVRTCLLLK